MVKMGKLVQEFENRSFRDEFREKMVERITSPKERPKLPLKSNRGR
jgi:hypothetical protein